MQQEKTYPIPARLMVNITRYLQTQPWGNVNELMYAITQICQPIDDAEARQQQMMNQQLPMPPGAGGDAQLPPSAPNGSRRARRERPQLHDVSDPPDKE